MSFCPSCGSQVEPEARFCSSCGTKLKASAPSPPRRSGITSDGMRAERRHLTVMFCDIADSTKLSEQLDPEDLMEVVRRYQTMCADVIERYGGSIAQYLGDGLLVYFGYPTAYENAPERAARAGLEMLLGLDTLNESLRREHGIALKIRLGIHTGLVVIGVGDSGPVAVQFLADKGSSDLLGVVLVSSAITEDSVVGGLAVLRTLQQPVLDLYAANDVATVYDNADARRRAGAQLPAGNFRQVAVAGARAGFVGVQEQLVATVRAWLAAHSAGR